LGCGLGRNLANLYSNSVGIEPDLKAVGIARSRGFTAFSPEEFKNHYSKKEFDSLLCSHVLEHMSPENGSQLIGSYLEFVKPEGNIVLICHQIAGYKSDDDHKYFHTRESIASLMGSLGIKLIKDYSFPFPRPVGTIFKHNETVVIGQLVK
jgi:2-polyprenyl-3-methyl-5-hydroxy-6-metoxy-1,4-benzoquinol methylase